MKAVHQEGMTAVDMCQMLGFLVKQTLALAYVKGPIGLVTVTMGDFSISFSSLERTWMLKFSRGSSEQNYTIAKWAKQVSAEQAAPPENTRSSQQPMGPFLKQTAF